MRSYNLVIYYILFSMYTVSLGALLYNYLLYPLTTLLLFTLLFILIYLFILDAMLLLELELELELGLPGTEGTYTRPYANLKFLLIPFD